MRIVLCCRVYSIHERPGGMIHVIVERAEALARAGHDVHVLTTYSEFHPHKTVINGVTVHHPKEVDTEPRYSSHYSVFCDRQCRRLMPTILHLDSWDKTRPWWHQRPGKPKVIGITNHGEDMGRQFTEWRLFLHGITQVKKIGWFESGPILNERSCAKAADVVITTCRFDRWMLSDLVGLGKKVKLVYNPVAPFYWDDRTASPLSGPLRFLTAAVWGSAERGMAIAKEACERVGAELVSPPPTRESRFGMPGCYDRCHALLIPGYQSQGYDLTVAEASARRRPIFYNDSGIATMEALDKPWIVPIPVGDSTYLVKELQKPMPIVPENAADHHRPEFHIQKWLEALGA